jgi:predicted transcriptional regulator
MSTKVTVNLPDQTVEAIKSIAEQRGTTVTEALRQVIEGQRFLLDEMENGNKLLLESPDQSVRQVVFNTPPSSKK